MYRSLNNYLLCITLFVFLFTGMLSGADYILPLHRYIQVSSSFGEFRFDHFHNGIDYNTAQDGDPLHAPAGGYMHRTTDSPFGYGRAIYFQSHGNYLFLFGHLYSYDKELYRLEQAQRIIKEIIDPRIAANCFFPPHYLDYRQDDVIGHTGETGVGFPHLHFAIYSGGWRLNPLVYGFDCRDTSKPVFETLIVQPMTADSKVNERAHPVFLSIISTPESNGTYLLESPQPVELSGTFRLEIQVFDRNNAWNKNGVYELKYYFDDTLTYHLKFDKFKQANYRKGGLIYDQRHSAIIYNTQYAYFLDRLPGNDMYIVKAGEENGGVIDSGELNRSVLHRIKIVCADVKGNTSTFTCSLRIMDYVPGQIPEPNVTVADGGRLTSADDRFTVFVPEKALYQDAHCTMTTNVLNIQQTNELNKISFEYHIAPDELFLQESITVQYQLTEAQRRNAERYALYWWNTPKRYWRHLWTEYDEEKGTLTAQSPRFGTFTVLDDTVAPEIIFLSARNRIRTTAENFSIDVLIRERGKGIANDNIYCYIDNVRIDVIRDLDRKTLTPTRLFLLTQGRHIMQLWAIDNAGNSTPKRVTTVIITPRPPRNPAFGPAIVRK